MLQGFFYLILFLGQKELISNIKTLKKFYFLIFSWALFFMSDVGIRFSSRSNYIFLDSELVSASHSGALGIETNHDFVFRLGQEELPEGVAAAAHHLVKQEQKSYSKEKQADSGIVSNECKAVVCRVQVLILKIYQ